MTSGVVTIATKYKLENDFSGQVSVIPTFNGRLVYVVGDEGKMLCKGDWKFIAPFPRITGAQFNDGGE